MKLCSNCHVTHDRIAITNTLFHMESEKNDKLLGLVTARFEQPPPEQDWQRCELAVPFSTQMKN